MVPPSSTSGRARSRADAPDLPPHATLPANPSGVGSVGRDANSALDLGRRDPGLRSPGRGHPGPSGRQGLPDDVQVPFHGADLHAEDADLPDGDHMRTEGSDRSRLHGHHRRPGRRPAPGREHVPAIPVERHLRQRGHWLRARSDSSTTAAARRSGVQAGKSGSRTPEARTDIARWTRARRSPPSWSHVV